MTETDTTSIEVLHQILPQMPPAQRNCVLYYSLGATVDEIAHMRGVTAKTVRGQLDEARDSLGGISLSSIRTIVLVRMMATVLSGSSVDQLLK